MSQDLKLPVWQVIIMLTPVRRIFHCEEQNGFEWLYAILTGAGSLMVALATKLVTWCALALPCGDCLGCPCVNGEKVCPCKFGVQKQGRKDPGARKVFAEVLS